MSELNYPWIKFVIKLKHSSGCWSLGLKSKENESWLYPMVESCVTEDVLKAWQRSWFIKQPERTDLSCLTNLRTFLKTEEEQRLKLACSGFERDNLKGLSR